MRRETRLGTGPAGCLASTTVAADQGTPDVSIAEYRHLVQARLSNRQRLVLIHPADLSLIPRLPTTPFIVEGGLAKPMTFQVGWVIACFASEFIDREGVYVECYRDFYCRRSLSIYLPFFRYSCFSPRHDISRASYFMSVSSDRGCQDLPSDACFRTPCSHTIYLDVPSKWI